MACGCVLLAYASFFIQDGAARTIRVEVEAWENRSWGLHNIHRRRSQCLVAIAGDGSRMNQCEQATFRHFLVPSGSSNTRTLYLRPQHSGYDIDDASRTARGGPCGCAAWKPMRLPADDATCGKTAKRLDANERAGSGKVAGQDVVRYRGALPKGVEVEVSLAPALGCEPMEVIRRHPGTLGIPGALSRYTVTSIKPGEPDKDLFRVPAGYTISPRRN